MSSLSCPPQSFLIDLGAGLPCSSISQARLALPREAQIDSFTGLGSGGSSGARRGEGFPEQPNKLEGQQSSTVGHILIVRRWTLQPAFEPTLDHIQPGLP